MVYNVHIACTVEISAVTCKHLQLVLLCVRRWLVGLEVRFLLRVQEVLGSIPGQALFLPFVHVMQFLGI